MIQDLALILIVAGIVTLIFKKLKQPVVLGYIVAGFLVSPHMPYIMSVVQEENIKEWADIGVMFTLFSLGLEFSFKKIVKMGAAPIISALTIVTCMMITGYTVGYSFGWSGINCVFLGGMLAMSSTTIIYKAFDDLGLRQQHFASSVMSVLILEDILAIVLMVMLTAVASGDKPDSGEMIISILEIAVFLILWFVVGIFAIPLFLRKVRNLMTSETLLIVSLGLCCLMAQISVYAEFSEAFGAFVMGSILAETIEAEKIEKTIEPVKNLFGAIFFVSVGMLVDPAVIVTYAVPIFVIVLAIIIGQCIFGTLGFFLAGQPLRTAMRCGFSMAQIGEFAFIIASLGLSLGVIADYLYPVVVAVSVITTFLTPYMIKVAEPAYRIFESHLPKSIIITLNNLRSHNKGNETRCTDVSETSKRRAWSTLLRALFINTVVYTILSVTVVILMLSFFGGFVVAMIPTPWSSIITATFTLLVVSPFLRAILVKKNRSEEWKLLWNSSPLNRLPLISTLVARFMLCLAIVFFVCSVTLKFGTAIIICIGVLVIVLMVLSRSIKHHSIDLERMFINNLRSRDIAAQVKGDKRPLYADRLLDRDIHIADIKIHQDSKWAGASLARLDLGRQFGVHISSILRGGRRINIPGGNEIIFPNDHLHIIGTDEQLSAMNTAMLSSLYESDPNIEDREMVLRQIVIGRKSALNGKPLRDSHLRDKYGIMVIGLETGEEELTQISSDYVFATGDILWVVGERNASFDI